MYNTDHRCNGCGEVFESESAFYAHRPQFTCLDPEHLPGYALWSDGRVWREGDVTDYVTYPGLAVTVHSSPDWWERQSCQDCLAHYENFNDYLWAIRSGSVPRYKPHSVGARDHRVLYDARSVVYAAQERLRMFVRSRLCRELLDGVYAAVLWSPRGYSVSVGLQDHLLEYARSITDSLAISEVFVTLERGRVNINLFVNFNADCDAGRRTFYQAREVGLFIQSLLIDRLSRIDGGFAYGDLRLTFLKQG